MTDDTKYENENGYMTIEKRVEQLRDRIDAISKLHNNSALAKFRMAQLCHAIALSEAFRFIGYKNLASFCEEEMPMSYSSFSRYRIVGEHIERLSLTEDRALQLFETLPLPTLTRVMLNAKPGTSLSDMLENHQAILKQAPRVTAHITVSENEMRSIEATLERFGLGFCDTRRRNVSDSIVALIADYERMKAQYESGQMSDIQRRALGQSQPRTTH